MEVPILRMKPESYTAITTADQNFFGGVLEVLCGATGEIELIWWGDNDRIPTIKIGDDE